MLNLLDEKQKKKFDKQHNAFMRGLMNHEQMVQQKSKNKQRISNVSGSRGSELLQPRIIRESDAAKDMAP